MNNKAHPFYFERSQFYWVPAGFCKRRKWQLTPVFLLRESHGQRSLAGYRTWFLNVPKTLIAHDLYIPCGHFQINCFEIFSFLCALSQYNGEGNGNPLQYSCLENPMDEGAW